MLERLSERTGRVLELARAESGRLGHHHVGTEHLLLGLLAEGSSAAARTLVAAGATLDGARGKVAEAVGRSDGGARADEAEYTARAARALERANRLSLRRDEYLEPEHVLLSLIDVEGTAGQVLRVLGVDVVTLRSAADFDVSHTDGGSPAPMPAAPARPDVAGTGRDGPLASGRPADAGTGRERPMAAGGPAAAGTWRDEPAAPRCPDCRAPLAGALAYRLLPADGESASRRVLVVYCARCGSTLGASPE